VRLRRTQGHAAAFARVYRLDVWGGSGTGSQESSTRPYRRLLQRLLGTGRVRRVVDLGCGDWAFSRLIDWRGVDYLGIDVVRSLIRSNRRLYACDHIRFRCSDFYRHPPPPADLYVLKDVLQHWTGAQVRSFLKRMRGRTMLVTNSVSGAAYEELRRAGGFRPLDIRQPPFEIRGRELLRYRCGPSDLKVVVLISPSSSLLAGCRLLR
jgi:SAM-dependent methyltransferase